MDQDAIIQYIATTFTGVDVQRPTDGPGAGDTFFIYDPRHDLEPERQFPFATLVTKDYEGFDDHSKLFRPEVFRLNIGLSRDTFRTLFGDLAIANDAGNVERDFATLDTLMPHPVYAPQSFVCVLNPSPETFEACKPLLAEAYSKATARHASNRTGRD